MVSDFMKALTNMFEFFIFVSEYTRA